MNRKKIAILQSNYIPWKGYFDLINLADEFIILDCVQFTKQDWRTRNLIRTNSELLWLTIPVKISGNFGDRIDQIEIARNNWARKHWNAIKTNYGKAPYFKTYAEILEKAYEDASKLVRLTDINLHFIRILSDLLGIDPEKISYAKSEFDELERNQRLVSICNDRNGSIYVSGPAAASYLSSELFNANGIEVLWADYSHYPTYPQIHGGFAHGVTVLDLLFNAGPKSHEYMMSYLPGNIQHFVRSSLETAAVLPETIMEKVEEFR